MKKLFLLAIALVFMAGCSTLNTKSLEYQLASDVHGKVYNLAAQVRGTKAVSQIESVKAGKPFYANCQTYSMTVADLLVTDYGADPAEVWLVQVDIPVTGLVWIVKDGKWHRIKADRHQVVLYKDLVLDNRWRAVLTMKDLEFEYDFVKKMNMQDRVWVEM